MKTLLWKDFRQNARILIAVVVLLLLPYVAAVLLTVVSLLTATDDGGTIPYGGWSEVLHNASRISLGLWVVTCAFIAGNAVAGERADRSAEFVACLPVTRRSAVASKAILAIGACLLFALAHLTVFLATDLRFRDWSGEAFVIIGLTGWFIFGVSWLFSALLNSPSIAAASGLGGAMVFGGVMALAVNATDAALGVVVSVFPMFIFLSIFIGGACFVGGVARYLRRAA